MIIEYEKRGEAIKKHCLASRASGVHPVPHSMKMNVFSWASYTMPRSPFGLHSVPRDNSLKVHTTSDSRNGRTNTVGHVNDTHYVST